MQMLHLTQKLTQNGSETLNVKWKTIKFLQQNIGKIDTPPKWWPMERCAKLDFIKIKNFLWKTLLRDDKISHRQGENTSKT